MYGSIYRGTSTGIGVELTHNIMMYTLVGSSRIFPVLVIGYEGYVSQSNIQ